MAEASDRWSLPLLAAGQAQKEITHNEALTRIDALLHPIVEAVAPATLPVAPQPGQGWVVGAGATGDWSGHYGDIAVSSENGWIFIAPRDGMTLWDHATSLLWRRAGAQWIAGQVRARQILVDGIAVVGAQQGAIAAPAGGGVIDVEARIAIGAMLAAIRQHGLIAT